MKAEYVAALAKQLDWWAFHIQHARPLWAHLERDRQRGLMAGKDSIIYQPRGSDVGQVVSVDQGGWADLSRAGAAVGTILHRGECYYVAPHIQRLVTQAARTLPDFAFDLTQLPSSIGFMVLGEPMEIARKRINMLDGASAEMPEDFPMFASVLAWIASTEEYRVANPDNSQGTAVWFVFLTESNLMEHPGYWPVAYFGIDHGGSWQSKMTDYERKVLIPQGETRHESVAHEIAVTMSMMLFLQQRVFSVRREHADRASRRRAERAEHPQEAISVLTLRRYAERADEPAEPTDVEWTCQWLVRGHWRQQRVGPRRALTRPTWIHPYVKGPEGRPFRGTEKITAVVR